MGALPRGIITESEPPQSIRSCVSFQRKLYISYYNILKVQKLLVGILTALALMIRFTEFKVQKLLVPKSDFVEHYEIIWLGI
ncbi:hypothetical protein C1H46_020697 [Malus baccata]|uniref:Uncharacterized protein n=1 Tax=Malus baccata TaxID=106549 RepID=A0A540M4L8_MALBA|nr:hypothetical protein C1H46_020697 [Malus baccata]